MRDRVAAPLTHLAAQTQHLAYRRATATLGGEGASSQTQRKEECMGRQPIERHVVRADADRFVAALSPDLLAGIRRRIGWTARRSGVRLQPDAIDDLTQDILLRLWQRSVTSAVGDFAAYAFSSASNLTIDSLRRRRAKKRSAPETANGDGAMLVAPWPPTPEQAVIGRDELRHHLARCRRLLSARQYRIFTLIYFAGFTSREVGERIGLHTSSVDSVLHRLRRTLRENDVVIRPRAARAGHEA
jgi:RNA polymerase sigma factor (sigma-70 family)